MIYALDQYEQETILELGGGFDDIGGDRMIQIQWTKARHFAGTTVLHFRLGVR